jgi:ABC-type multidrug transport system ATPase subunit
MLELDSITRSFGERKVLDDVTFSVARGRMTGFVGGNGAGKTTTMRVMMGVLSPTPAPSRSTEKPSPRRSAPASATCRRSAASTRR